jgi:hypothetical protein
MRIRVKFLATFRTVFGGRERDVEVPRGGTVGDVLDLLGDTPERRKELFAGGASGRTSSRATAPGRARRATVPSRRRPFITGMILAAGWPHRDSILGPMLLHRSDARPILKSTSRRIEVARIGLALIPRGRPGRDFYDAIDPAGDHWPENAAVIAASPLIGTNARRWAAPWSSSPLTGVIGTEFGGRGRGFGVWRASSPSVA